MADRGDRQQSVTSSGSTPTATKDAERNDKTTSPSNDRPGDYRQDDPPKDKGNGEAAAKKKPSLAGRIKSLPEKAGLDKPTVITMFKGSLPPTIAIAMYQSPAVAAEFTTLGYLVAIASVLGFCIMPRGKFIQNMALNILGICLGSALSLLALWSSVQARKHTTPPGAPPGGYNSSQSAVCAIWLFVIIYAVNVLRSARPQFNLPAIMFSIFTIVSMSYGPMFPTMPTALSFMQRLLTGFLTGLGLATAVAFLVFPVSSRTVVFKEMTGYIACLKGVLKAQSSYMKSLETFDPFEAAEKDASKDDGTNGRKKEKSKESKKPRKSPLTTPASKAVKETFGKLLELHGKLQADITPAKREFAIGKLQGKDISQMFKLLQKIFLPVLGLSSVIDILERRSEEAGWGNSDHREDHRAALEKQLGGLHFIMRTLHTPFETMIAAMEDAYSHVMMRLELAPQPKKGGKGDEEKAEDDSAPGMDGFRAAYDKRLEDFFESKQVSLKEWCEENGIKLSQDFFESSFVRPEHWDTLSKNNEAIREHNQQQLFFVLYMEFLLYRAGKSLLELVDFADQKQKTMKTRKLILPGEKTSWKWLAAVFGKADASHEESYGADVDSGGNSSLYLGLEFDKKKDPEHLPPTDAGQRTGEWIRKIPMFFRSEHSAFGFRVACATMCIAIVGYLRETQQFFIRQRLLWAMIMVAISMNRTAGQSTYNFVFRVLGTFIAMCASLVIWYIVDEKAPGVIVFLWFWIFCTFYVVVKYPKYIIVALLSLVTAVLIVGYELQVDVLGVQASESNGQPAYPIYLLAPYRLACVVGGIAVAWIWTIFPYPISESTELRKDSRIRGTDGSPTTKGTHAYKLDKARLKVFSKLLMLIQQMKTNSQFSIFQLRVGGRFPKEEYEAIIDIVRRVLNYTALIFYASSSFSMAGVDSEEQSAWSADFRKLAKEVNPTSHGITSHLALLSSSMSNGQPLPPYMQMPKAFGFVKKLESMDRDILSVRHIAEPEYSAFAVIQICAQCLTADIDKLTKHVKTLVGELDFSFHAVSTRDAESSASSSSDSLDKGKVD